jgi:hypothetical protein
MDPVQRIVEQLDDAAHLVVLTREEAITLVLGIHRLFREIDRGVSADPIHAALARLEARGPRARRERRKRWRH